MRALGSWISAGLARASTCFRRPLAERSHVESYAFRRRPLLAQRASASREGRLVFCATFRFPLSLHGQDCTETSGGKTRETRYCRRGCMHWEEPLGPSITACEWPVALKLGRPSAGQFQPILALVIIGTYSALASAQSDIAPLLFQGAAKTLFGRAGSDQCQFKDPLER